MTRRIITINLTLVLLLFGALAQAQDKTPWTELSYEERQFLQQVESQWESMPAERQQRLLRGATRWQQMSPQQRTQAQSQQRRFQNLSQGQRQTLSGRCHQTNAGDYENNSRGSHPRPRETTLGHDRRQPHPRDVQSLEEIKPVFVSFSN
jgi:hypothetical protein